MKYFLILIVITQISVLLDKNKETYESKWWLNSKVYIIYN